MANLRITFDALHASLNKVFATFHHYRDKMPKRPENKVRIVGHFSEGIRFLRGFFF